VQQSGQHPGPSPVPHLTQSDPFAVKLVWEKECGAYVPPTSRPVMSRSPRIDNTLATCAPSPRRSRSKVTTKGIEFGYLEPA
jgi:hypothetical protein